MAWRRRLATVAVVAAVAVSTTPAAAPAQEGAPPAPGGTAAPGGTGTPPAEGVDDRGLPLELGRTPAVVTLITGDRVTVRRRGGAVSPQVEPGRGREQVRFRVDAADGHLWVLPSDALDLVGSGRVDRRLFDVAGLVAGGYDDARRDDIPLIVQPAAAGPATAGTDAEPPAEPPDPVPAEALTAAGAEASEVPAVGVTAMSQPKDRAAELWDQVVTTGEAGDRRLGDGLGAVWLDGLRRPTLDHSVPQVRAPEAWAAGLTGAGVRVAVLDTGVDAAHPDLAGRVVEAQNFTGEPDPGDAIGHGTHVASIVAGSGAASGGANRGVAPGADLLAGKVCEFEGCFESDILEGMAWAAGAGARVVNLSLGGRDGPEVDPLEAAIGTLSATEGTLFVVASGNDAAFGDPVSSPASADAALAVAAVDDEDRLADFSNRGPRLGDAALKPEISAPGVDIMAARAGGRTAEDAYVSATGTSMAAPHVAAGAAIVAQQHPDWTGDRIRAHLVGAADTVPGVDAFGQGAGRLDVGRAVGQAVTADPAVVSGGRATWPHDDDEPTTQPITYRNAGAEPVTLALAVETLGPEGPSPDGLFALGAETVTVPAGGEATVDLTIDTSVPGPPGHHSAWVTATAGGTVVTTPAAVDVEEESYDLTVEATPREGDTLLEYGVFVAGLDRDTWATPYLPEADPTATVRLPRGRYGVLAGIYSLQSGTEMVAPEVVVDDRDQTLVFDAREADPVDITVENRRAEPTSAVLFVRLRGDRPGRGLSFVGVGPIEGTFTGHVGPEADEHVLTASHLSMWFVRGPGGDVTRSNPEYHLAWFAQGRMFDGLRRTVRDGDLAAVRTQLRATGPGQHAFNIYWPQVPGDTPLGGSSGFYTPLPFRRTVLHNTDGVEWRTDLEVGTDPEAPWELVSTQVGEPRALRPGPSEATWNQAVLGPVVSRVGSFCTHPDVPSRRAGDVITASVTMHGDGAGNPGCARPGSSHTTLRRDGQVVGETDTAGVGDFTVPAGSGRYRLEVDTTRAAGAHLSTRSTAAWTFRSGHVDGDEARPLPLLAARFTPPLDVRNRAQAGTRIDVPVAIDRLGDVGRVGRPAVEVSFDDGARWAAVPVREGRGGSGGFVATVQHPPRAGFVSLRTRVGDDRGNAVEQTTIRAYELTIAR